MDSGLYQVDSVATLNVTAANFSRLFYIKTNDLNNLSHSNISYGVIGNASLGVTNGVNPFMNISYSNANIHSGFANPALSFVGNTSLYQNYTYYTSKAITGAYALSDIFSNKDELMKGVGRMDASFNESFANLLNNASHCENVSSDINSSVLGYPYLLSCKTLVDNLLKEAENGNVRGQKFLSDLKAQSDTQPYWIIFQPGDVMGLRLTYTPRNGSGNPAVTDGKQLGINPIYNCSYKIYLRMT
jgi:hypothetical protein